MWYAEPGRDEEVGADARSPTPDDSGEEVEAPARSPTPEDSDPPGEHGPADQPLRPDSGSFRPLCPHFEHLMQRLPCSDWVPAAQASTAFSPVSQAGTLTRTSTPTLSRTGSPVNLEKPSIQLAAFQSARIHDASKRQTDQNLVPLPGFKKPPSLLPPRPDSPAAADWARRNLQAGAGHCTFGRDSDALPERVAPRYQDLTGHGLGSWKEHKNEHDECAWQIRSCHISLTAYFRKLFLYSKTQ
jgi:hypothetical protein